MNWPKRFSLPRTLTTVTESTWTLNMSSTAALISGLVASETTRKTTWLFLSATKVLFSEITGARTTCIRRSCCLALGA